MIKNAHEVAVMREGGRVLASVLSSLLREVQPGVATKELDKLAEAFILKTGARPAFKGYEGFPATLCTSINEEFVHTPPSDRVLQEGDVITLDIGLIWKDMYLDMARTVPVGEISSEAQRLIRVTKKAGKLALKKIRPGNTLGDIGNTIERLAKDQGLGIAQGLCGHGIGRQLHEEPKVLNEGKRHAGLKLKEGMVICVEPMFSLGSGELLKGEDGQTYRTKDGSLSAHFEDTIVVTKDGCEVLTKIKDGE